MTAQDKTAARLTHMLTYVCAARYVGDGVIVVGEEEEVIVNVSEDGKHVDVAYIVRDVDGAPTDSIECLENGSARNGKRIVRAVLFALSI